MPLPPVLLRRRWRGRKCPVLQGRAGAEGGGPVARTGRGRTVEPPSSALGLLAFGGDRCNLLLRNVSHLCSPPPLAVLRTAGRSLPAVLAALIVGGLCESSVWAAPAAPGDSLRSGQRVPIEEVRGDANEDTVPDRVGDTVTVAGRITAGRGRLAVPVPELAALQDGTAGIHLVLPQGPPVEAGDSVRVRGVVEQAYGLTRLRATAVRVRDGPARVPNALPLTVATAAGEPHEGRLARVRGRIAAKGTNDGGEYLLLRDPNESSSSEITVFIGNSHTGRFRLARFQEGDEVRVTGVVGQHDFDAPYADYYQLEPRSPRDLAKIAWAPPYLRVILYVLAGGGLVASVAALVLRAVVRRRTRELEKSRARFRRLAEATSEGIALHDADGNIIDANAALAHMVGVSREALIGNDVTTVVPDARPGAAQTLNGNVEVPTEAEIVQDDGTAVPVEIEERDVTVGDKTVHVRAIRDISKRKEWEDQILRAKQEAEQMAQLKSTLINNMSHELRTPITNITGYAEVIMNEADGPHEQFAAQIRESGKRLSETLQAVLDMAQIEAGTLDVLAREVVVKEVVREVIDRHRQQIDDKALAVEVFVQNGLVVQTDRTLLYRILNNLVQNAVKFTEEGTVGVKGVSTEEGLRMTVRDTGVGIAPGFRPNLFDPFKQESEGVAREYEGAGLGLTLTKQMVGLLGGSVRVESTKGEGSTFTVDIPADTTAEDRSALRGAEGASPPSASS